ncbi:hypothetical protein VP01_791g4 [Puccinia sorghi]|uniref:Prefoldin subunit 4 n=1 Tax=Puccinia sorghi TaxID=27349 RepID=A0A0L6UAS9_9BASI|nr:hypothetical protein VP01_791g4 [Puccinia sorghi]
MQMLEASTGAGGEEGEKEVTMGDQKMINEFSNLNMQRMRVKKQLKSKTLEHDDLVELENELLLGSFDVDEEPDGLDGGQENDLILYKLDTSYIHIQRSRFQEVKLAENLAKSKDEIAKLNSTMDLLGNQMSVLKKKLYSKFGNTINLEAGDEDEEDEVP